MKQTKKWFFWTAVLCASALSAAHVDDTAPGVQKIHLVQDDAQDYMVSKVYPLKYVQANDLVPFVLGIVMRCNINSTANCVVLSNNAQWLTVTCPEMLIPCVDDFVAKADRNIPLANKGKNDNIAGTGITRAVYRPRFRSGEELIGVLINSVIGEGPYSSLYAWDKNSNQIYWKDNQSNTEYVEQFLGFIDRPPPQVTFHFKLYEVRDSDLKDIGIEYLAWKNGPGLNLVDIAWDVFSINSAGTAALTSLSGPVGGFFVAPQFDASFIRMLSQNGTAKITNTATLTVANSDKDSGSILFDPQLQNITKDADDQTAVNYTPLALQAGFVQTALTVTAPIVNIHYGQPQEGFPKTEAFTVKDYKPGEYTKFGGTVFFSYAIQTANVVERNNSGNQLVETTSVNSNALIDLNKEIIIAKWDRDQEVEQTIGVPFLCKIPVLKYLFSTTTKQREVCHVILSVKAELLDTSIPVKETAGKLIKIK